MIGYNENEFVVEYIICDIFGAVLASLEMLVIIQALFEIVSVINIIIRESKETLERLEYVYNNSCNDIQQVNTY